MKALLDTNAYSELKRGHPAVAEIVRESQTVLLSVVVVGELLYGFQRGSRYAQNFKELQAFLNSPRVEFVPATLVTADRFGRIATALRKRGTPLPSNDIWIAAQALETGADLISFDQHFSHIEGLGWVCPTH